MLGWYYQLDGHGFGWTPGVGDGQGGLACCDSWGRKESSTSVDEPNLEAETPREALLSPLKH